MVTTTPTAAFSRPAVPRPSFEGRFRLEHVSDDALHAGVKTLAGRYNMLTADLLAHLAEVDARGIYRERACSSLYTYCVYELRFSEDEALRRARAARAAREYPLLFEMLAEGAIHLTGLLLLAPYLRGKTRRSFSAGRVSGRNARSSTWSPRSRRGRTFRRASSQLLASAGRQRSMISGSCVALTTGFSRSVTSGVRTSNA